MELGERYLGARERVRGLVADLDDAGWATDVPGCPGWTVHDVVAHLVGITDDGLTGNMDGAPGPAWTAAQVAKRSGADSASMLAEWDANAAPFADAVTAFGIVPPVIDLLTHEQDLRGALGRPGADEGDLAWVTGALLDRLGGRIASAGLPALRVRTPEGERVLGEGPPAVTLTTTRLELFRASLGRRSETQVRALAWEGDPDPYLGHLGIFELHPVDLAE